MTDRNKQVGIIVTGGPAEDYPPWTDAQRDAQIEALRFAYCDLVQELHRAGRVDAHELADNLDIAPGIFLDSSKDTLWAIQSLSRLLRPGGSPE